MYILQLYWTIVIEKFAPQNNTHSLKISHLFVTSFPCQYVRNGKLFAGLIYNVSEKVQIGPDYWFYHVVI